MSNARLVLLVCAAQVAAQIGAYTWPALLPGFLERWELTNAEAGWLTGVLYAAYAVSVPVLVTATDRIDPKRIYLLGVGCTVLAHLGFALWAEGFWSALAFRVLAGVGWAGTYMTGLKLLADRVSGRLMSRATAGHAAGIGIAGGVSFVFAGAFEASLGWQSAFVASAWAAGLAWIAVAVAVPRQAARPTPTGRLFDFRPVFRNRSAMAYAIAYAVHTWEMNAVRGWGVAFLAWVALQEGGAGSSALAPTVVIMAIWLDSSSLTAGAAGSAAPERRGATLAIHSMFGYGGGFVGPLLVGLVLDWAGGMSRLGWGLAFASIAAMMLAGRIAFALLRPRDLDGDRASG